MAAGKSQHRVSGSRTAAATSPTIECTRRVVLLLPEATYEKLRQVAQYPAYGGSHERVIASQLEGFLGALFVKKPEKLSKPHTVAPFLGTRMSR